MGAGGETLATRPPAIPEPGGVRQEFSVSRLHSRFSHTAWKQKRNLFPNTIQPTAIHWYPPPTLLCTWDIHLLTSNRLSLGFVLKYQCIVQELSRNIMHHTTHHSFSRSFFFFLKLFHFLINHPPLFDSSYMILSLPFSFQQPVSPPLSRGSWRHRIWCKMACFGWNTLPPFLAGPGQPGSWSGHNISPA